MAVDRGGDGPESSRSGASLRRRAADQLRRLLGLQDLAADRGERYEQQRDSQPSGGSTATHGVALGAEAGRSQSPGAPPVAFDRTAVPTSEGLTASPAPRSSTAMANPAADQALTALHPMEASPGGGAHASGGEAAGLAAAAGSGGSGGVKPDSAPPLSASGQTTGVAIEDSQLIATGQLAATGGIQPHVQAGTYRGVFGVLTVEASGRWTYQLDNADPHVQRLNNGEAAQDHFQCLVVDAAGHQLQVPLVLEVRGSDDAAVISGVRTGAITEDQGPQAVSGQLSASDIDSGDQPSFVAQTLAGSYGTFTLQADGQWHYNADPQKTQGLKDGQQVVETFPLHTTNAQGESVGGSVSITVTGTDDRAVFPAVSLTAKEDGGIVTGRLVATDVDATSQHYEMVPGTPGIPGVSIAPDGSVRIDPVQPQFQSLAAGEHRDLQIPVQVVDEHGTAVQSLLSVRIDGTNDAPVVTVRPPVPVDEGSGVHSVQVLASDVDSSDKLIYGSPSGVPLPPGVSLDPATGLVSIDTNHPAYNSLGVGETRTVVVPVVVSDGHGGATTTQVSLELHGTNDAPTLAAIGQRTATEGDAPISGQLSGTDPDTNDQLTYGVAAGVQLPAGFSIQSDGHWTFDPQDPAYNALRVGDHQQLLIPLQVSDGHGGISQQTLAVDLTGSNDRAVISGTSTGSVTEDLAVNSQGKLTTSGTLSIADPDAGEAEFKPMTRDIGSVHFSIDAQGHWSAEVDNSKMQAMPAGSVVKIPFVVQSADGKTSQRVVVQIHGTNDAAVIAGVKTGSVTEDTHTQVAGVLTVDDPDKNNVGSVAADQNSFSPASLQGAHGSFSIKADGTWAYDLNNTDSTVQALHSGEQITEHFTVHAADGTVQDVTVTIDGTNDAPILSVIPQQTAREDGAALSGQLSATDVDSGDVLTYGAAAGSTLPAGLTINPDGSWSFDPSNPAYNSLKEGQQQQVTAQLQVSDGHGGVSQQTLTIALTGTNDAPTVASTALNLGSATEAKDGVSTPVVYTEAQLLKLVGASDSDTGDALHVTAIAAPAGFGSFSKLANGNWQFTPPDDKHQAGLSVSITVEDSQHQSVTAHALLDVQSATDSARANLAVTSEAQVMRFGSGSGNQNAYKETGTGALGAFSLEVMAVGDPNNKGSTTGSTGQVLFNLSAPGDSNVLSLWRPAALSIAFGGSDHATQPPLDLTTGQHRLTLTWDKTSGTLNLYDNGKVYQHWDNISKGIDLPAGTIVTVGQKMNNPGAKAGFNTGEQFHGDLFSVTLANQKVGPADVSVPLANHLPVNQLLLDLREANGHITDGAAGGSVHAMVSNNVGTATQQVATTASPPPVGARLNLNVSVTPPADGDDHISRELLRGLPPGTVLSDGSGGHSFTVPANGEVNVLTDLNGWQHLDQLSAQLPSSYRQNLPLQLVVETTGPDGAISRVSSDTSVLFDPSAQTPALPPLAAPADVDQAPTVAAGSETTNEDTSYGFKISDFGYTDSDGDALHHITVTSLPPANQGQLLLGGVAVHAGQQIPAASLGDLSFQPAKDFNGDSHFGFSASDGSKDSAAAQMGVHVSPVADQTTAEVTVGQDRIQTTDFDVQGALSQNAQGGLTLHAFGVGTSPIDPATGNIDPKHLQDTAVLQLTPTLNNQRELGVFGGKSSTMPGQPAFVDAAGHNIGQGAAKDTDDSQLNQGESLLLTLPALANSAQLTLNGFSNQFVSNDHLIWHAYDANGHEVAAGELSVSKTLGGPAQNIHNLEIHTPQPFAHLLITAGAPSASTGYSASKQAEDRSAFSVQNVMTQLIVHTTELKLDAHFASDYRGQGESVGFRISGLSDEARLDHGTRQSDGSWLVTAQEAGQLHLLHTREQHLSITAITHDGSSERSSAPLAVDVAPKGSTYEVISGRHAGDVFEAGSADHLETGGTLQVDSSSGASPSFLPQTISNAYGSFAIDAQGHWHFQVDAHSQATQALGQNEIKDLPFSVSTSDGLQQQVMVHLIGQDTSPVIGGVVQGTVTEDQAGQTESRGHVDFIDPDSVESLAGGRFLGSGAQKGGTISATGPTTVHGKYGDLVIQPNGDWAYHLDHTKADPLRSGQVEKEMFNLIPAEYRRIGGVVDSSHASFLASAAVKVEISVHGSDEGPAQVGGVSASAAGAAGASPLPAPPPPPPASQQSQELQDLLQHLHSAGLDVSETQLPITRHDTDPLTGAPRDILELHTAQGTVVQTLTTHSDGSQQVDLDTTRLDPTAQAALPAHGSAAMASQPLTSLDQQADAPEQHASSPDLIDHGLDLSAFQLDQVAPAALQAAVRSLVSGADAPSFSNTGPSDQSGSDSGAGYFGSDHPGIDADQLAHVAQLLASSPESSESSVQSAQGHHTDADATPITTAPDPFHPDATVDALAADDGTLPPPPLPEHQQDQTIDHLASLS